MDLIRELKDVRFELNLRGYDCDAVDAFLAKIRGEIAELEQQRERAQERVSTLESQVADGESDTEGTLRRTLVLAQRLADETVADAKQTAEGMIESAASEASRTREAAQAEADAMLSSANEEAAAAREAGRQELERAREDAARTSEEVAVETSRVRQDAVTEAERILADAEAAGAKRVSDLEATAKAEIAANREPLRAEIRELEAARESLLTDIAALEVHLAEQRTRVRTAVEALRAGMSGSIDDLERVATDDEAMSTAPQPSLSGAGSDDVAEAPDLDVFDTVQSSAAPAPSATELADNAAAAVAAERADGTSADDDEVVVDDVIVEATDDVDEHEWSSSVGDIAEAEVIDEEGPATEPIPVVVLDDDDDDRDDSAEADVVDLDAAPSALFGTNVAEAADVVDADSETIADVDEDEPESADGATFLSRFGEAIGDLPVSGRT